MKSEKHRVMLDQMRAGNRLEGIESAVRSTLPLQGTEADGIRRMMRRCTKRDINEKGELYVDVFSRGSMRLTLRRNKHNKKSWYLNLDGNPLKFLTGRNIYGWPNAERQIVAVYKRVLKSVERESGSKFPERVWKEVEERGIYLNHLEFACYTFPLENKLKIISGWRYMYDVAKALDVETQLHVPLDKLLGVKAHTEYDTSFQVSIINKYGAKELMFTAYDKEAEQRRRMTEEEESRMSFDVQAPEWDGDYGTEREAIPEDIKNRLRLEIGLTSVWFHNRGINTLAQMTKYLKKNFGGKWTNLVQSEVDRIMRKACLLDMWSFPRGPVIEASKKGEEFVPEFDSPIPAKTWLMMLSARDEIHATHEDKLLKADDPEAYGRRLKLQRGQNNSALSKYQLRQLAVDTSKPKLRYE